MEKKGRYTHTALFVGRQVGGDGDPGGISCHHTVCRFQGRSKAWNGVDDDAWFLGGNHRFTLVHFADDDAAISADTLAWLPGWWTVGREFYLVKDDGRAISTLAAPAKANQIPHAQSTGYYFDLGKEIVFIWLKPRGSIQVERWTKAADKNGPAVTSEGIRLKAERFEPKAAR